MRVTFPLRVSPVLTLYSRPGCHLCENAEVLLRRVVGRRRISIIDVTHDRILEDRYLLRIPVLCLGDEVLAEGAISREDAHRARAALNRRGTRSA